MAVPKKVVDGWINLRFPAEMKAAMKKLKDAYMKKNNLKQLSWENYLYMKVME